MGSNLGGLAAIDQSWLRTGVGKLFIVPYPVTASEVAKVTIGGGGTGYVQGGIATFSGGGTPTRQAKGYANVTAGAITGIVITDPGAGYTSAPTVTVATGSGASLTPVLGNGIGPVRCLAPSASPAYADYQEGWMQRFYDDPTTCKTLNGLLSPWGMLTAEGFKPKFEQTNVDVDPNDGPKFNLAAQELLIGGEFTFLDVNADHWADALSTPAGNITTIAAATGKAGRTRIGLGAERALNKYALMYRMPSTKFLGEFDHLVIPRATLNVKAEPQFSKSKELTVKIGFSAQAEPSLISPVNGEYMTSFFDYATAAGL